MDTKRPQNGVLAMVDDVVAPMSTVMNALRELGENEGCDPHVITQASLLNKLPVESSSMDSVACLCRSPEFPGEMLFEEVLRVLKPGGTFLICKNFQPVNVEADKASSDLQRKLMLAGFLETLGAQLQSIGPSGFQSFRVKAKKPSWKIGSSFALRKSVKTSVKVQLDDDSDLIDEDSLLTEEDLKKPQLPLDGNCEVGSTRKACKNCTCGRAEEEEKVKLGLTTDQLSTPQSACGSCGLGDAFRCGTCPYKGLPPFKLGEKVSITGNFLTADM